MTPSEAAQQILQHANAAGLSPKDWAEKFNKFNPKQSTTPMAFDPDSVTPSKELLEECNSNPGSVGRDCTLAARWGARQAVEALRHQWPEPITDRPPTEEDGDDGGMVQVFFKGRWFITVWEKAAKDQQPAWLHTPGWRPKPEPSPKQRALALLKIAASDDFVAGGFSPDGVELLRQVVQSAPDTTP